MCVWGGGGKHVIIVVCKFMFISVWWAHRLQLEFWRNQGLGSAWGRKLHHCGKCCDVFCQCDGLVHFAQPHWVGLNHHIWLESQAALDRQQRALLQTFVRVFCWGRELKLLGCSFCVSACLCVYVCVLYAYGMCVCVCLHVCVFRVGGGEEESGRERKLGSRES